jgi:bacterioferritin (cytochrome b1)
MGLEAFDFSLHIVERYKIYSLMVNEAGFPLTTSSNKQEMSFANSGTV